MYPYSQSIEPTATKEGEFTDGNPQTARARTILRSYWPNMIQRELLAIVQAAGITPEQETYNQVLAGIQKLDADVLQAAYANDDQLDQAVRQHLAEEDTRVLNTATDYSDGLDAQLRTYLNQQIADAIAQAMQHTDTSFVGQITHGPIATIPPGWLALEGGSYNRSAYPKLWDYINKYGHKVADSQRANYPGSFTTGNGSTTFRLPNMKGLFARGQGGNSAGLGQLQGDAIRNVVGGWLGFHRGYAETSGAVAEGVRWSAAVKSGKGDDWGARYQLDASRVVPTADENRPVNVAWRFIIRAV